MAREGCSLSHFRPEVSRFAVYWGVRRPSWRRSLKTFSMAYSRTDLEHALLLLLLLPGRSQPGRRRVVRWCCCCCCCCCLGGVHPGGGGGGCCRGAVAVAAVATAAWEESTRAVAVAAAAAATVPGVRARLSLRGPHPSRARGGRAYHGVLWATGASGEVAPYPTSALCGCHWFAVHWGVRRPSWRRSLKTT